MINKEEKAAIILQRQIRSVDRRDLHYRLFKTLPKTIADLESNFDGRLKLASRVDELVHIISSKCQIINPKNLYHYTSLSNLANVINTQYFYGQKTLKKKGIAYTENSFCLIDEQFGDSDIICFGPGLVDRLAFAKDGAELKAGACRLLIDVSSFNESNKTSYNRFIKLFDICCFWKSSFEIGKLSVDIASYEGSDKEITFTFNGLQEQISLTPAELVFYGEDVNINRFCLNQLPKLIHKMTNVELRSQLFDYMESLNDNALRKFLIVFAQNLTLFAEYNFNSCLALNEIRINEVLLLGDSKVKYDFSNLQETEYQRALHSLSCASYENLSQYLQPVSDTETITQDNKTKDFNIYNKNDNQKGYGFYKSRNFTDLSDEQFADDEYINTRLA